MSKTGLFENIFGPPKKKVIKANQTFESLTAYKPYFTSWNGSLYESELVRSVIDARARHISKLQIEFQGSAQGKLKTSLRKGPNSFQTWGQFLYRLSTILDMEGTAIICPILDQYGELTGYFPILPTKCEVREFEGIPYLRYEFGNGKHSAVEWEKCGVMTKFQYKSDFFGTSNRDALLPTMELINLENQGVAEAVKSSATFRFYARMTNFSSAEDLANEQKQFTENNFKQDAGEVLLFPNTYDDIHPIESKPYTIDVDELNFIRTNVYNYFGVNEDILQNKAYGDSWSAFYEGAIEPFAIQFSDVITNMTFTNEELAFGNLIMATANRLQYMSTQDKLNVSTQMADRGILNRDEVRAIWNLPPLPDGAGQTYIIRGEYYSTDEKLEGETEDDKRE